MTIVRRRGWRLIAKRYETYVRPLFSAKFWAMTAWRGADGTPRRRTIDGKVHEATTIEGAMVAAEREMERQLERALRTLRGQGRARVALADGTWPGGDL